VILPLLIWPAARCPPVFAAAAVFILVLVIVWTVTFGVGRLGDDSVRLSNRVHAAQAASLAVSTCTLVLAALFAERRSRETLLSASNERLRTQEESFRRLLGTLPAAIYTTDKVGHIMYCNDAAVSLWGASPELGRDKWFDLWRLHYPDGTSMPLDERPTQICLTEGRAVRGREALLERPDGTHVPIIPCPAPLVDERGNVVGVVNMQIDITERKRAENHQRLLVAELDHRVKNVLATVSAVASRTRDANVSGADFVAALAGRIQSMAATHELLSHRQWTGVSVGELVRRELAPYVTRNNTDISGPELTLSPEAGQAVSMVLHELTTNAAKHGALSDHDGRVSVHWQTKSNGNADATIGIEWQEIGCPAVRAPDTTGYGMEVIRDLIPYELGGTVDLAFTADGLRCRLEIPADWLNDGTRWRGTLNGAHDAPAVEHGSPPSLLGLDPVGDRIASAALQALGSEVTITKR
jgi:PAS domain S-box-containing protein